MRGYSVGTVLSAVLEGAALPAAGIVCQNMSPFVEPQCDQGDDRCFQGQDN